MSRLGDQAENRSAVAGHAGGGFTGVEAIHDAGGRVNEDIVHVGDSIAWVIDGATGLQKVRLFEQGESDAAFFVRLFNEDLQRRVDEQSSLADLIEATLSSVSEGLFAKLQSVENQGIQLPTASIAMMRSSKNRLDFFLLGDCRIIAHQPKGFLLDLCDGRHKSFDEAALRCMREYLKNGRTFEESRAAAQNLLVANRNLSNQPGGYWVLGNTPEAARHGIVVSVENPPQDLRLLLMTDGFSSVLDYGLFPSPQDLFRFVEENGLVAALKLLRATEDADQECRRYARFKRQDDATAIYLQRR
jgi:hypothetical protein